VKLRYRAHVCPSERNYEHRTTLTKTEWRDHKRVRFSCRRGRTVFSIFDHHTCASPPSSPVSSLTATSQKSLGVRLDGASPCFVKIRPVDVRARARAHGERSLRREHYRVRCRTRTDIIIVVIIIITRVTTQTGRTTRGEKKKENTTVTYYISVRVVKSYIDVLSPFEFCTRVYTRARRVTRF